MKNLNLIAEELFNKVRGRFPTITIGNEKGEVTNKPEEARYYDFDFVEGGNTIGRVSISLTEKSVSVMYNNDFITNEDSLTKESWYNFLREIRVFAKKRLLNFDIRDITKSNLNKRDYKFLSANQFGDITMESKMYGTTKTSFQNFGNARLAIKHTESIDQTQTRNRTKKVESIFIETNEGERFKYPYKHLTGARAMARHVAEGGKFTDEFGQHIIEMSTELGKLKKFKSYLGRSGVMAETLGGYSDVIRGRITTIKKTLEGIQKPNAYKSFVENFEKIDITEVPEDVAENWIDQLTIKQFNEELSDVFPYIYRLVSEATKATELSADELLGEAGPIDDVEVTLPAESYKVQKGDTVYSIYKKFKNANFQGHSFNNVKGDILDMNPDIKDLSMIQPGMVIQIPYYMGSGPDGASRGLPPGGFRNYESTVEDAFEELMGQFSDKPTIENKVEMCPEACCGKPVTECSCGPECKHCDCYEKNKAMKEGFDDDVFEGFKKGDTVMVNDERGPGSDFSAPGVIIGLSSKGGKARIKFRNNKTEILPIGMLSPMGEGNEFAQKVQQMKAAGAKKGDKFKTSDGKEHTLEDITEYVLSMYDRHTGQFPKGETAVLTAIEKDFGESYITPAKKFIEMVNQKYKEIIEGDDDDILGLDDFDDEDSLYDPRRDNKGLKRKRNRGGVNTRAPIIDIDDMEFFLDDINEADQQTVAKLKAVKQNIEAGQAANDADAIMAAGSELGNILADEVMPEMYKFLDRFVREFEVACKKHRNDPDPKWQQACKMLPGLKAELEQSKRDAMQAGMGNMGRQDTGEGMNEIDGQYMTVDDYYDPNYNGPDEYNNEADAIEDLLYPKTGLDSEKSAYRNMLIRKYKITKDTDLQALLKGIRDEIYKKNKAEVDSFDQQQQAYVDSQSEEPAEDLDRLINLAGVR